MPIKLKLNIGLTNIYVQIQIKFMYLKIFQEFSAGVIQIFKKVDFSLQLLKFAILFDGKSINQYQIPILLHALLQNMKNV